MEGKREKGERGPYMGWLIDQHILRTPQNQISTYFEVANGATNVLNGGEKIQNLSTTLILYAPHVHASYEQIPHVNIGKLGPLPTNSGCLLNLVICLRSVSKERHAFLQRYETIFYTVIDWFNDFRRKNCGISRTDGYICCQATQIAGICIASLSYMMMRVCLRSL